MHIIYISTMHNSQNTETQTFINKQIKDSYIKAYLVTKRNRVLIDTITWINPENMLNENSQKQEDSYSFYLDKRYRTINPLKMFAMGFISVVKGGMTIKKKIQVFF